MTRSRALLFGSATFLTTFLAAVTGSVPTIRVQVVDHGVRRSDAAYRPRYAAVNGEQLVMIYFGKAHCAWSNRPEVPQLVEGIKMKLAHRARERGLRFAVMGVALDWSPEDGIAHLGKLGHFDEVAAGFSWANSVALEYFGDAITEPIATRQILVIRRRLLKPDFTAGPFTYRTEDVRLLTRKVGLRDIHRWAQSEAAVPGL